MGRVLIWKSHSSFISLSYISVRSPYLTQIVESSISLITGPPSPLPGLCIGPGNLMKSRKFGKGSVVYPPGMVSEVLACCLGGRQQILCLGLGFRTLDLGFPVSPQLPTSYSFATFHGYWKGVRRELLILMKPSNIFPLKIQGTHFSQRLPLPFLLPSERVFLKLLKR